MPTSPVGRTSTAAPLLAAVGLGLLVGCGAGDRQAPGTADLVIAKALSNS